MAKCGILIKEDMIVQRFDGKVVAVSSKPVSVGNSLLTGNLTGKKRKFGLFRTVFKDLTPIYLAKRKSYKPFPCYLNNRE